MENYTIYRTAESVSPKHPDKLCDQISDAILDAYLTNDPHARVAVETCGGHGEIFIVGEVTANSHEIDIPAIVTRITGDDSLKISVNLVRQSPEIAQGVDTGGAGDQGIMIGYACDETPELLPIEVIGARRLNQHIYSQHPYDGKTQLTIVMDPDGNHNHFYVKSIVASFQNTPKSILQELVDKFVAANHLRPLPNQKIEYYLNPAGDWNQGGFSADTGLTGRKLIVDNYGPRIPIGGGAFSGKDSSKVDRSAAYMARRIAVDYLRKHHAHEVFVRLAYAIGYTEPLEHTVAVDGKTQQIIHNPQLTSLGNPRDGYNLTPQGIIKSLNLLHPIYEPTARYGHFGEGFEWDK